MTAEVLTRLEEAAIVRVRVAAGPWTPPHAPPGERDLWMLVKHGLLARLLPSRAAVAAELIGAGDLLPFDAPPGSSVLGDASWVALTDAEVAVVSLSRIRNHPEWSHLSHGLLQRLGHQLRRSAELAAIAHQPRAADRVTLLMQHLAERWGQAGPGTLVVAIPLTHERIGQLIGAQRSTVTLALNRLAADGVLERRDADGAWIIHTGTAPSSCATARGGSAGRPSPQRRAGTAGPR